jgi:HK97 family phage major capsid protein
MEAAIIAPRCMRVPIGPEADGLEAPIIDETSRANGSRWGGVQVYRRAEADTVTATKPKFGLFDLRLEDLMGLAYATERLLRDARALEAVMGQGFSEEFAFKVDDEIVRGSGVGECLGILNADATVSVSKETGQSAATLVFENVVKMWARLHARARRGAVWYYNQDVEPQLLTLNLALGTAGQPVYLPPGGLRDDPFGTLFGRPMVPIEQAATLGTVGDLILMDPGQYVLIDKGGIEAADSMHVRFIYNERAFRWVYRINGRPKWHSAITPYKGSNTQSAYVTLATRA